MLMIPLRGLIEIIIISEISEFTYSQKKEIFEGAYSYINEAFQKMPHHITLGLKFIQLHFLLIAYIKHKKSFNELLDQQKIDYIKYYSGKYRAGNSYVRLYRTLIFLVAE
jgi:hypothetical protein